MFFCICSHDATSGAVVSGTLRFRFKLWSLSGVAVSIVPAFIGEELARMG